MTEGFGLEKLVRLKVESEDEETARGEGQGEHFVLCLYREHRLQTKGFD